MFSINIKTVINIFGVSILIWILLNFSVALLSASSHAGKPRDGANHHYVLSILYDGDLDIKNQIMISERHQSNSTDSASIDFSANLNPWAAALSWIPFYGYIILLDFLNLDWTNCGIIQADFAQVLSAIFSLIILFINITKMHTILEFKKKSQWLMVIFFISTPGLWYVLIEPSRPMVFSVTILSTILLLFVDTEFEKKTAGRWFMIGALSLVLAVTHYSNQIVFLIISMYIVFLKVKNLITWRACFFYTTGVAIVAIPEIMNAKIKFEQWVTIYDFISNDIFRAVPKKFIFFDSLFGQNGILSMYPIYIMSIFGLFMLSYKILFIKEKTSRAEQLVILLFSAALINYLVSIFYWYPESNFLGTGLFESQLILLFGFIYFFNKNKHQKYKNIFIFGSLVWALIIFLGRITNGKNISMSQIITDDMVRYISGTLDQVIKNCLYYYNSAFNIGYSMLWFLMIFGVLFIMSEFVTNFRKWKNFINFFSVYLIGGFVVISFLNIYQNYSRHPTQLNTTVLSILTDDFKRLSYEPYLTFLEYQRANSTNDISIKNKIIDFNRAILAGLNPAPSYYRTEQALQGGRLFKSNKQPEISFLITERCSNKYELDEPFD